MKINKKESENLQFPLQSNNSKTLSQASWGYKQSAKFLPGTKLGSESNHTSFENVNSLLLFQTDAEKCED